jgi:hypothetical protein
MTDSDPSSTEIKFGDQTSIQGDLVTGEKRQVDASGAKAESGGQVLAAGGDIHQYNLTLGTEQASGLFRVLEDAVGEIAAIQEQAAKSENLFEASTEQVNVMGDYKELHDQLHQVQFIANQVMREVSRFDEMDVRDAILSYSENLRQKVSAIQHIASRNYVEPTATAWQGQLQKAQIMLEQACSDENIIQLKKAILSINSILQREPTNINGKLIAAARAIPLEKLMGELLDLKESLQSQNLDAARLADYSVGLQAIQGLQQQLAQLLNDHDTWQWMDWKLQSLSASLDRGTEELELSWDEVAEKARPLFVISTEEWASRLQTRYLAVEKTILPQVGDADETRRALKNFCAVVSTRFYDVDLKLKTYCGELRKIGEPMNRLLIRIRKYAK